MYVISNFRFSDGLEDSHWELYCSCTHMCGSGSCMPGDVDLRWLRSLGMMGSA